MGQNDAHCDENSANAAATRLEAQKGHSFSLANKRCRGLSGGASGIAAAVAKHRTPVLVPRLPGEGPIEPRRLIEEGPVHTGRTRHFARRGRSARGPCPEAGARSWRRRVPPKQRAAI